MAKCVFNRTTNNLENVNHKVFGKEAEVSEFPSWLSCLIEQSFAGLDYHIPMIVITRKELVHFRITLAKISNLELDCHN